MYRIRTEKLHLFIFSTVLLLPILYSCGEKDDAVVDSTLEFQGPPPRGAFLTLADMETDNDFASVNGHLIESLVSKITATIDEEIAGSLHLVSDLSSADPVVKSAEGDPARSESTDGRQWYADCFYDQQGEVDISFAADGIAITASFEVGRCPAKLLKEVFNAEVRELTSTVHSYVYVGCSGRDLSHLKHLAGRQSGQLGDVLNLQLDTEFKDCENLHLQFNRRYSLYINATVRSDVGTKTVNNRTTDWKILSTDDGKPCHFARHGDIVQLGRCMHADRHLETNESKDSKSPDSKRQNTLSVWKTAGLTVTKNGSEDSDISGALELQINNWRGQVYYRGEASDFDYQMANGSKTESGSVGDQEDWSIWQ